MAMLTAVALIARAGCRSSKPGVLIGPHQSGELDQKSAERRLQQRYERSADAGQDDRE
jgi:hypothetical protein